MADIEQARTGDTDKPGRRQALKSIGLAAGALAVAPVLSDAGTAAFLQSARTGAPPRLKVLTASEYAAADALAETIIPADAHSPGAHAARVADYIDLLLSESPADIQSLWRDGLAAVGALAQARFKAPFARLTPLRRIELVAGMAANEAAPQTPVETFFIAAKDWTIRGYYTSEIGIHKDLRYQGNQFLGEFVGCTAAPAGRAGVD